MHSSVTEVRKKNDDDKLTVRKVGFSYIAKAKRLKANALCCQSVSLLVGALSPANHKGLYQG